MNAEAEVVEGELLPDVYEPAVPATLFRTSDPDLALDRMSQVARTLVKVIDDRKLYATINGKRHLLVGAWTTLGGMVGVFPIIIWTRPNETGDGYVARAEARTRDGALVGAAESECSRAEQRWKGREPYALRSMASTRAISRALRAALEQVVILAGYDPTAAEELPVAEVEPRPKPKPSGGPLPEEIRPTAEQKDQVLALIRSLTKISPEVDWGKRCQEIVGNDWDHTTTTMAGRLIEKLKAELGALADEEAPAT